MYAFVKIYAATIFFLLSAPLLADTGSIKGTVNYCEQGGMDGMQVYLPGLPFVVITSAAGQFRFDGVAAGTHSLYYRAGGKLLNRNPGVVVLAGQVTDLSVIAFCDAASVSPAVSVAPSPAPVSSVACAAGSTAPACVDADGDGVVAARDCNDADAAVYPGAVERCDGVDNNCNGAVDEHAAMSVLHGLGACAGGQVTVLRCDQGFSDCDGNAANGCEIDVMGDDDNCGSCGNICAASELCTLGTC
ncbi:MAG: hypothetical protein GXP17_06950 [Gammaproteobacteria bacterium]|nr:hypothetical protein [Gammaproteobacteria bacterium]